MDALVNENPSLEQPVDDVPDPEPIAEIEGSNQWRKEINQRTYRSYLWVIIGSTIYSIGIVWILQLGGFFSGGVTGASQLIVGVVEKFVGDTSIRGYLGIIVGFINIPLIAFGWRGVSKKFAILTVVSVVIQTLIITILSNLTVSPLIYLLEKNGEGIIDIIKSGNFKIGLTSETLILENAFRIDMNPGTRLLLAIIGGAFCGIGGSMNLRSGGSSGGMDIIANFLMMKKRKSFVKYQMIVDGTIVGLSALISVENVLYTLVRLVVYMKTIEAFYRIYMTIRLHIITTKASEIREALLKRFYHGMTIYDAVGGYTMNNKKVIEIYVSTYEVQDYANIIKSIDPCAFIVSTNVKIVKGNYIQKTIV